MTATAPQVVRLTPPGRGAVATLLVEGEGATRAVQKRFHAGNKLPLASLPGDRLAFGHFGSSPGEEVIVRRRSRQWVEVHCHGGDAAVAMIEAALVQEGCRAVGWPCWVGTCREDSIAAAARLALATARTERTAAILLDQLAGSLRREIRAIQDDLDNRNAPAAARRLGTLLGRADVGRHLVEPWRVVLAGQPNVGKSSLINALVGYPRAIVHHAPGTTRDVVSATTAVDGWPVELSDTAGLHQGDDPIERAGVELAGRKLAAAELVLLVFDASRRWSDADRLLADSWPGALVVHNKSDLPPSSGPTRPAGRPTSALTGQGIGSLVDGIAGRLVPKEPEPGAAVAFTAAQIDALAAAAEALRRGNLHGSSGALAEI